MIKFYSLSIIFLSLNSFSYPKCVNCYKHVDIKSLGYWNEASSNYLSKKYCSKETLCYSVKYNIDQNGLRTSSNNRVGESHLFTFGGSFTFGEGVKSELTWPELLSKKMNTKLYNISRSGIGAAESLQYFDKFLEDKITKKGKAIFFFIPDHIKRMGHRTSHSWLSISPTFVLKENKLVLIERRKDIPGIRSKIVNLINYLNYKFESIRDLNLYYNTYSDNELKENFVATIIKLRDEYERRFEGEFYFVVESHREFDKDLKKSLQKNNINIVTININDDLMKQYDICSCDKHPSKIVHEHIAKSLYENIYKN